MFTGLVEELGKVKNIKVSENSFTVCIEGNLVLEGLKIGDSISTNGVCLTVVKFDENSFYGDVMPETFRRTSFKGLKLGDPVNLERAMMLGSRFGGHIVSGHVDGVGKIIELKKEANAVWMTVEVDREIMKYIIMKGSVCLDGISLTVANVDDSNFQVSLIPETVKATSIHKKRVGDVINVECDVVGKYVERLLGFEVKKPDSKVTQDLLMENGFV